MFRSCLADYNYWIYTLSNLHLFIYMLFFYFYFYLLVFLYSSVFYVCYWFALSRVPFFVLFCKKRIPPMMGVSLCQWRVSIGMFNLKHVHIKFCNESNTFFSNEQLYKMLSMLRSAIKNTFWTIDTFLP